MTDKKKINEELIEPDIYDLGSYGRTQDQILDGCRGALVGLAVGDAIGTTTEFQARDSYNHVTEMVGGGVFKLKAGEWTDDTSMALCLGASLIHEGFNPHDQMNRYKKWRDEGYMSSNGRCFDIGNTVSYALNRYYGQDDAYCGSTHPQDAGNGSLMRLAPIAIKYHDTHIMDLQRMARNSSRTTHGAVECLESCAVYATLIADAIHGVPKDEILLAYDALPDHPSAGKIRKILDDQTFYHKTRDEISSSGYVIHTLEAALWCYAQTDNFKDCILLAANLGDDSDTVAAIAGQLAGAYYGESAIPSKWKRKLVGYSSIKEMADKLAYRP